ncbi:MAG: VOC family protein [Pseudomonadota bacterium]
MPPDEPAPSPLGKVAMIMLGVSDLETSLAFYRDTLGLTLHGQADGLAFFDVGELTLALSAPLWHARGERHGATEVVFAVDDVRDAHDALVARGVTFTQAPRLVTQVDWAANFTDPDGHVLSLFGPSSER